MTRLNAKISIQQLLQQLLYQQRQPNQRRKKRYSCLVPIRAMLRLTRKIFFWSRLRLEPIFYSSLSRALSNEVHIMGCNRAKRSKKKVILFCFALILCAMFRQKNTKLDFTLFIIINAERACEPAKNIIVSIISTH